MTGDQSAAKLVTLPKASKLQRKPANYFTKRRARFLHHGEIPFPDPVAEVAGHDVYDMTELLTWDARRINREAARIEAARTKESEAS